MSDILPPHDLEKEQEILASAITRFDHLALLMAYPVSMFYIQSHQYIFKAMKTLFELDSGALDISMMRTQLKQDKRLQQVEDDLIRLFTGSPLIMNMRFNLNIIYHLACRRKLINLAENFKQDSINIDDFVNKAIAIHDDLTDKSHRAENPDMNEFIDQPFKDIFKLGDYIKTGIAPLDNKIIGLFKSQVIIISGRPGDGKTTLGWQIAQNITENYPDEKVIFFSYEMPKKQLYAKTISSKAEIETWQIHSGRMDDQEMERVQNIHESLKDNFNMFVFSRPYNILEARAKIKEIFRKHKVSAVFFDYLQEIPEAKGNNENEKITIIMRVIKQIALEYDFPVVALSQYSRGLVKEKREPQLEDLRGSGSIEQAADAVIFLHTKDRDTEDEQTVIILGKNRINKTGKLVDYNGDSLVIFNKRFNRFENNPALQGIPEYDNVEKTNPGYFHD